MTHKSMLNPLLLQASYTHPAVGKEVACPRCGRPGIVKVKWINRKTKLYPALYIYHYDPASRKITWHYYGRLGGG